MTLYGSVDLHSNNNYAMISDGEDRVIHKEKLANDLEKVDAFFSLYKSQLSAIVVESTYNGYWLVDGLQELGYAVKLANPSAMQPYRGLKYSNDETDALWLNRMNRLGVLPEGYIYPKPQRGLRDLLRRRMFLVHTRTSLVNSLKHQYQSWKGLEMSRSRFERLEAEEIREVFKDGYLQQAALSFSESIQSLSRYIDQIEDSVFKALKEDEQVRRLVVLPGIGKILGWMIRLEIGERDRFKGVENYLSYCGLVESRRMSNEKLKGRGNAKNRNKYLRWAYGEAAIAALRNSRIRKYHDRLARKKGPIKAKAIVASKLARISFMLMKDSTLVYDENKLFFSSGQPAGDVSEKTIA